MLGRRHWLNMGGGGKVTKTYRIKRSVPFKKKERVYDEFPDYNWDFIPIYDDTDHFYFLCKKCNVVADATEVMIMDASEDAPCLWIYLECEGCSSVGKRKIYLMPRLTFKARPVDRWVRCSCGIPTEEDIAVIEAARIVTCGQ